MLHSPRSVSRARQARSITRRPVGFEALEDRLVLTVLLPGFTETLFAGGLSAPTAMEFAPDGRLFVTQQGGDLRIIKNGSLLTAPFVTLSVNSDGERGLLGVTFDPNFATNQFVYVYYTTSTSPIHNRISRFTANGDVAVAASEVVLADLNDLSGATNHNGGAIHFGPDGKLYVAVGDNANSGNSQTLDNRLGKMLRFNSDGTIPSDNPFFNLALAENRAIWAWGLRNPYTFAFQPGATRMFINDVGQNTWEEIDDGIAGSNYGWPTCEGDCSPTNPNFRDPLFQYAHGNTNTTGCAITGGAFYNPTTVLFPNSYIGDYFFADFCTDWIRRYDVLSDTVTAFATSIKGGTVDLKVDPDGVLYYLSRNQNSVYRIDYPGIAWDGGGTTNNWSDANNWAGNVVPLAEESVLFNGTSVKNATVNAAFPGIIDRVRIDATYTGTITLGRSLTAGSLAGTGPIILGANTLTTGGNNRTTTFNGTISGAGGITKDGTGSFYLGGNSTYDGTTTINNGSILVSANNALGTPTGGTSIASGASARLVFERGVNYTTAEPVLVNGSGLNGIGALVGVGNSSFAGPITLGSASTIGAYPAGFTFTLGGAVTTNGHAVTIKGPGNTIVNGAISGGGSVTKNDAGTTTLSGSNGYTGSTTVTAGTLSVTGSIASSAVTVNSAATLVGTGTVGGTTVAGGTMNPGVAFGILTGSNVDFSAAGRLTIQLKAYTNPGTNFDRLNLSGTLTLGGTSTIALDLAGLATTGTATGIALYVTRLGTFPNVQLSNNPNGYSACFSYGGASLDVSIVNGSCAQWASVVSDDPTVGASEIVPSRLRASRNGSQTVTIASMDSGVDYTHPALARNIWINQNEIPNRVAARLRDVDGDGSITLRDLNRRSNQRRVRLADQNGNRMIDGADLLSAWSDGVDNDGNGYVDDLIGWDFVNNDNDPMDDSGHGTHGSDIIVQVDPAARIVPLKILDADSGGSLDDARRALDYALMQGIPISSNGWSASVFSPEWLDALRRAEDAGHLFITAAGNGDPALLAILQRLHLGNVLVVGATDTHGALASFSNWSPEAVDVAVPGINVTAARLGGGSAAHSGTSTATAVATGFAGLLRGRSTDLSRSEIVDAILGGMARPDDSSAVHTSNKASRRAARN
jgi:autotransporter-associated beta strand protein